MDLKMKEKKVTRQSKACWALALTAIFFLSTGVLIGWFPAQRSRSSRDIIPLVINEISADEIGSNLRFLTSIPHVAGTEQDALLAEWIKEHFIDAGLDEGKPRFESLGRQPALGSPEETSENVLLNFNAFSASGMVEGNLVYAHFGRKKDFEYLLSRGINVSGSILLIRLGAMFRGSKITLAEKYGAKGVILFSDRMEKTTQDHSNTYPNSWWMPGKGTEYGLVSRPKDGDLLTPFYPALDDAFRLSEEGHPSLPKIPVQSIGYEEAEILLHHLSPENLAPSPWVGKLNAPYRLGPNFIRPGWKVVLNVSTTNERRTIYNTIGILRGSVEDDRYVILGNHRDAWAFGALDPSSGTAAMIEITRVLGLIKTTQKWRPRRTIVFCSWSASEYGFIGSYEWIQQHAKVLSQRAVAYLNVDAAVTGNRTMYADAFPTLKQLIIDSSKLIPNPNIDEVSQGLESVYDTWLAHAPDRENHSRPMVGNLGGGSDFVGFAYVVGVPSSDIRYASHAGSYPTYHSLYDSFLLASEIVDKGFVHHQAVARMWAVVALKLADSIILPLDIRSYAQLIERSWGDIEENFETMLESSNATLRHIRSSVERFVLAVQEFVNHTSKDFDENDELAIRRFNDKLMLLERYFIDPRGLPERPETNHIIFSPSVSESHVSDTFAGLVDLLVRVGNHSIAQDPSCWNKIKQHLASISFLVGEAARSLNEHF